MRIFLVLICGIALASLALGAEEGKKKEKKGAQARQATNYHKAKVKLVAGSASGSLNAPNSLAIALVVTNDGEATAEDVQASSISIAGGNLTQPATLPEVLGAIPKNGLGTLGAIFTAVAGTSFQPGGSYTIKVEGTFREERQTSKFALAQSLRIPPAAPGSAQSLSSSSPAHTVSGAHYPHQPTFPTRVNEGVPGWTVPAGPDRPAQPPSSQTSVQPAPQGDPPPIDFETNTSVGLNDGNQWVDEPSGAVSGGGDVFLTTSSYGYSSPDGVKFTKVDPTTLFPNADGGFWPASPKGAFDKMVQYAPSIERFIWIFQFSNGKNKSTIAPRGHNRYRITAASPANVVKGNWIYWDITSLQLGGGSLDYPDVSVGDNYLYVSGDLQDGISRGRVVIRIPLKEIKSGSTINFRYTIAGDGFIAWGGHLTQNTLDEAFWAGAENSSTLRVFNWPESSTSYGWTDVPIRNFPATFTNPPENSCTGWSSLTPAPDRQNWTKSLSYFPWSCVVGATRLVSDSNRQKNQLLFAWSACSGLGFPQPHVQWVALDRNNNFALISQQQIWNANYAYGYPAFVVNSNNDIGMSLEFGGGGNYENHVVGFWGDYLVYITTSSDVGTTRFGDFVTIRPYTPDLKRFAAFGYGITKKGVDTRYVVFSRPKQ
jgi:hypothetical protein